VLQIMIELEPATSKLAALIDGVRDDQMTLPTPCEGLDLAALLNHIDEGSLACINAATKTLPEGGSQVPPEASGLAGTWRTRIPERLDAVANAWRDETAWTGITQVDGFTFPGEVAGLVVLTEFVVHGWDVARASGQHYECEPHLVEATYQAMQSTVARNPDGVPGAFGAPVEVADEAPLLDRLIGLSGRNPAWAPSIALV
jgi:uncharacterized protein (TIGR03086 family)